jgi:hypothetical protein
MSSEAMLVESTRVMLRFLDPTFQKAAVVDGDPPLGEVPRHPTRPYVDCGRPFLKRAELEGDS